MKNFLSGDVSFQKRVLCDFQQSLNYKNFSSATSFPFIAATRAGISPQFEVGL